MALTLASDGRLERFAAPSLREHTTLALTHAAWKGPSGSIAADRLELDATSNGNVAKHEVAAAVRTRALRVDGAAQGDATLSAKASFDARAPTAHVAVTTGDSRAQARARRHGRLRSRAPRRHLERGRLGLAPGDAGAAHARRRLRLRLRQPRRRRSRAPARSPASSTTSTRAAACAWRPTRCARSPPTARFDLAVDNLDWSRGDREVWRAARALARRPRQRRRAPPRPRHAHRRRARARLRRPRDRPARRARRHRRLDRGRPARRRRRARPPARRPQGLAGPAAALSHGRRHARPSAPTATPTASCTSPSCSLGNRAAGTTLSLRGGLDAGAERRSLSLRGELTQDLAKLWAVPGQLQGRGTASVQLRLDSGNLRVFHALAAVRIAGATVELPHAGVKIESMDGEIPLTADLVADADGMHLLKSSTVNAYSELRFADQHPLLQPAELPLDRARHDAVHRHRAARRQPARRRQHRLAQPARARRARRPRHRPVQPRVARRQRRQGADARARQRRQVVARRALRRQRRARRLHARSQRRRARRDPAHRRRHLLDLLDLARSAPHATPPSTACAARSRSAIPITCGSTFNHGFANAKITFGGLARLVRVDELRGIPMGPLIDRVAGAARAQGRGGRMSRIAIACRPRSRRSAAAGCIKAPEIVLVDRATALEQQAAGSYGEIEHKLARATMAPRPVPLTPEQLETLGMATPSLVDDTERTDADRVDALLQQHCVGEAKDGLVVETHDACKGAADRAQSALLDRPHQQRAPAAVALDEGARADPKAHTLDEVRRAWHATHARGVVCGGWMQTRRRQVGGEEVLRRAARLCRPAARVRGVFGGRRRARRATTTSCSAPSGSPPASPISSSASSRPTASTLYFVSNRNTTNELYRQEQAAPGAKLVFDEGADVTWPRLSPDGKRILYISFRDDAAGRCACATCPTSGAAACGGVGSAVQAQWIDNGAHRARQPRLARTATCAPRRRRRAATLARAPAGFERNLTSPAVSPDGRWLVYVPIERYVERVGPGFAARAAERLEAMRLDRPGDPALPLDARPAGAHRPAGLRPRRQVPLRHAVPRRHQRRRRHRRQRSRRALPRAVRDARATTRRRAPRRRGPSSSPSRRGTASIRRRRRRCWSTTCSRAGGGGLDVYSLPLDGRCRPTGAPSGWRSRSASARAARSRRCSIATSWRRPRTVTGAAPDHDAPVAPAPRVRRVRRRRLLRQEDQGDPRSGDGRRGHGAARVGRAPSRAARARARPHRRRVRLRVARALRRRSTSGKTKMPAALALKRIVRSEIADTLGDKDGARARARGGRRSPR